MKRSIRTGLKAGPCLVFALVVGWMPAPATSKTLEGGSPMPLSIVVPYLKIQTALFSDSVDNIRANAGNVAAAATALGSPAVKIDTAAAQLTSASELPGGVHIAHGETTRQQWLQEGEGISNPYEGSSAPACGSLR